MLPAILNFIASLSCDGKPSSSIYNCLYQGTICSNHGICSSTATNANVNCVCSTLYGGQYCEVEQSTGSSSGTYLAPVLGSIIPTVVIAFLILACVVVGLLAWMHLNRRREDDWEIELGELEMGEQLGAGGYGEVFKAQWKGTEVAVKVIISDHASRELERNFKEEARKL